MNKVLRLTLLLTLITTIGVAQTDQFWDANRENRGKIKTDKAVARLSYPDEFKLFDLNEMPLKKELFSIVGNNRVKTSTIISLPNATGNLEDFEIFEASNFEPDLQARFPEIRAYSGKGITDKFATLKLSVSPQGIQTMVFRTGAENEFIEPYSEDHKVYSVFKSNKDKCKLGWSCTTPEQEMVEGLDRQVGTETFAVGSSTGQLKTMRLAQSCNGEYANYFGATSAAQVGLVLAAYNATLTRCNGIYEKDLALHLNLIGNTTAVIYYSPSTDPYSTTLSQWNLQLQQTLTSVIGNANYDIGHMFGRSGGGGNAGCIGCVCVNPATSNSLAKGAGITSPADGIPQGNNFDIDYVAHEVGHQLGANHTFSMSSEGTGVNKEVGSGITIMGYAGITSQDVAPHSIDIFHQASIAQIQANLANKTCPVSTTMTANAAPTIGPLSNYNIPISTPFALTGTATDPQGNASLTYCWEQNDNSTTTGTGSVASPTKTTGPNWLSFLPTATGTRLFPRLSTILAGANVTGPLTGGDAGANIEALSSVARTLNFRLTVRDNHLYVDGSTVGQTAFSDVVVSVVNTGGAFAVTSPNTNITWNGGSTANVTWNVSGTTGSPINCASVNILLSTDGGQTFPTVLATSAPNDGSQTITVPNTPSSTCRIKVESVGNIFFDISNTNFTIGAALACGAPTGLASSAITQTSATVSWSAASNPISYDVQYKAASSTEWIDAATGTTATSVNLAGLTAATLYDYRVRTNCSGGPTAYTSAQFTTASAVVCNAPTGLASSSITQSGATVSWSTVGGAISYTVEYKEASSGSYIALTPTTSLSANLSGLTASTLYDWRVRTNCSSGSSAFTAAAQFTTSAASSACPGIYDVSTNGTISGAATITLNTDVKGTVSPRNDIDNFRFVITTGGTATITLTTLPANYNLSLHNSAGSQLAISQKNGTQNESISGTLAAGTYYARVTPKGTANNATTCYTLRVTTGTASRNSEEELEILTLQAFPNPTKNVVNVLLPRFEGTATINMYDAFGRILMQRNTNQQVNRISISTLPTGIYMIKANSNSKDLGMTRVLKN